MGLFDDPYVDPDEAERIVGSEVNRELALQATRESITLLKNEDDLLPLDLSTTESIAVVGPNAHRSLLGGYSGVLKHDAETERAAFLAEICAIVRECGPPSERT